MLFSRTAIHEFYTLCYLNHAENETLLSSPAVAKALGIPQDQAATVLQSLNHTGLVQSSRGHRGEYQLTKQLDEISVVDVLDVIKPPENDACLRPTTCHRDPTRMFTL